MNENNISLIMGDCLEEMPKIADRSVDLILCDLPYGTTACRWDVEIPLDLLWKEYKRIIKERGNIVLFGTGLFAYRLALSNERMFRYELIWKKSKCGSPLTAKYMPLKKHENILVFGRSAAKYNPQMLVGEPYKRHKTPHKTNNHGFGITFTEEYNQGTRHPSTVLDFQQKWRRQDQVHPTQKPVELCEWLIRSYSDRGDMVLDNCMGSGSTGVACARTGRSFIGIEKEEKYYKIAKERIDAARVLL